jgi:hypothetical protein
MRIRWICLQVCPLLWSFARSAPARAEPEWIIGQPSDELRMTDLSFGATLDGGYGFGITPGLQMGIPIVDGGLIRPINDSFYLEPGLFMGVRLHRDTDTDYWAIPEVGPRWNFHLTPRWDAFATLKLGWAIGNEGDFWVRGTIGMQWWFARQWALRLESTGASIVGAGGYIGLSYRFM